MEKYDTTDMKLFLIKLGEISLKGLNRGFFEKKLKNNIKLKLHPCRSLLTREKGRFYLYVDNSVSDEKIEFILRTTFGVVGFSKALVVEKDWKQMVSAAAELIERSPLQMEKAVSASSPEDLTRALT